MTHPHGHPFWDLSLRFVITTTLILLRAPTTHGADDPSYVNCSSTIQCGVLQDVSYPFWGLNRASYCGKPNYELTCQDSTTPLLTVSNQTFRVLQFNGISNTMTVARSDYWETICPTSFNNNTQEITSSFNYTSDTVANNLTLFYGCEATPSQILSTIVNQFNCNTSGNISIGYFLTKNASDFNIDPAIISNFSEECSTRVVLPAYQSAIQSIELNPSSTNLVSAIDQGFGLQWTVDNQCSGCLASGGQCGWDNNSSVFVCYCQDKSSSSTCSGMSVFSLDFEHSYDDLVRNDSSG